MQRLAPLSPAMARCKASPARRAIEARLARIYMEASEAARRFFLRRGFEVLERRDLLIGEVPIHNFAMEKRLQQ
jgi:hypothetical protein